MINLRLGLLLFVITTVSVINAVPAKPTKYELYVGQYFHLDFPTKSVTIPKSPKWTVFSNDSVFQGIPTENDVGTYSVEIRPKSGKPYTVELVVKEESESECGAKETFWIEAGYEIENTVENRIEAAIDLEEDKEPSLRVYSLKYSRSIRTVEDFMSEKPEGNFVVVWKVSCDDTDEATSRLDEFIQKEDVEYDTVVLTKGHFTNTKVERNQYGIVNVDVDDKAGEEEEDEEIFETDAEKLRTTTEAVVRTTRKIGDNQPVVLNSLKSYTCVRGSYCELRVPAETFKDVEDGDTFKLNLTIHSTDGSEIWMVTGSKGMTGVPMNAGEFYYRLEAKDKAGQSAVTPFSVTVKPSLPSNHRVEFELDKPRPEQMATDPSKRNMLVKSMARAMGRKDEKEITLHDIRGKENKTIIVWSNNTLPYNVCHEEGINAMEERMIIKNKMRTKLEFVKAMGNLFYLRQAHVFRTGNCEQDVEVSTTAPTIQSVQEADSQLIVISGVLIVLLLVAIAVILYCACLKKTTKKKTTSTEYVGKGLPVVFPDEVEDNDHANAGTPMLAREERPPLKVSQHENPLYKPPPPMISNNSPRLGHTSTSSHQKLPPPFIPP